MGLARMANTRTAIETTRMLFSIDRTFYLHPPLKREGSCAGLPAAAIRAYRSCRALSALASQHAAHAWASVSPNVIGYVILVLLFWFGPHWFGMKRW